ncbi:MAG: transglycosylase domain-containing protein [Anaerolineaceae bacterium]|nr:transglycosylase domain-containing protein [Anaerolineaceae bacterium]
MSDEFDPRNVPDEMDDQNLDDDVPFHLPKSEDYAEDDDETADLIPGTEVWQASAEDDFHQQPTMPMESGSEQPKSEQPKVDTTLPGTAGLDPNPDFLSFDTVPREVDRTARHEVVRPDYPPAYQQQTQPVQRVENARFQRPAQPTQPGSASPIPARPAAPDKAARLPGQNRRRKSRRGSRIGCIWIVIGLLVTFCGGLTLVTAGLTIWGYNRVEELTSERLQGIENYRSFQSTFFYDRNGIQLYEAFGEGRRTKVKYADFPQNLIDASVAIEDDNFFTNPGIDVPATLRAFAQYVGIGEGSTGGSTITQQVVRNILFDFEYRAERSVQRKLEEIVLALALTQKMSKENILELYLNEIYYGNLAYGAQAAAQTFFGKNVGDLTLGEAALLAGLPQAPAELDPLNPDPAVQDAVYARWRQVLDRMVLHHYITNEQRNDALRQGLTFTSPAVSLQAPHFTVYAQNQLEDLMTELGYSPEEITGGGWQVYTTLDLRINTLTEQAMREQVAKLTANNVSNAAVVVLKPLTGEILGMVGSVDYNNDAIDGRVNVAIALRQPGSTMKPFTYSASIESGLTPADVIWDTPTKIGIPGQQPYEPVNYDRSFHGPVIMRTALANSYNIPAVQTLRRIGVDRLLELMQRFGVESLGNDASRYGLSLTLGGGEISLVEMANAYSVFANQGVYVPTTAILCVLDNDDTILYQYENGCPRGNQTEQTVNRSGFGTQALDPRIAFIISDILSDNVARSAAMGANSALNTGALLTSVKTGTTNDVKDNWTMGYTHNVTVGVWVGNSRGEPMVNSSGLTGAAPIWNRVITSIYNDQSLLASFAVNGQLQNDQLVPPSGVSLRQICDVRRLRDPATDCSRINEWMLDTPAGIPDADGNMYYPPPQARQANQAGGPVLTEVSPGVYRVLAFRLDPGLASSIQFATQPGETPPPAPIYCQVPPELAGSAAGAQDLLFITPPVFATDAAAAERYAQNNGLAYLPTIACSPDLLQGGGGYGPVVTTAIITSPQPNAVLNGETPIIGTVQFTADQGKFYKVEVIGGGFADWVTIGTTHTENVVNGQLENLYVPGLAPGSYRMRLVIVDQGGGFLQTPYEVPFMVQ